MPQVICCAGCQKFIYEDNSTPVKTKSGRVIGAVHKGPATTNSPFLHPCHRLAFQKLGHNEIVIAQTTINAQRVQEAEQQRSRPSRMNIDRYVHMRHGTPDIVVHTSRHHRPVAIPSRY